MSVETLNACPTKLANSESASSTPETVSHLSCCLSSPRDLRKRSATDQAERIMPAPYNIWATTPSASTASRLPAAYGFATGEKFSRGPGITAYEIVLRTVPTDPITRAHFQRGDRRCPSGNK